MPTNTLFSRQKLAQTGQITQHKKLLLAKYAVGNPTMILVECGTKILRWADGEAVVQAGQIVLLAENQTFDVLNQPDSETGIYQSSWLSLEPEVIADFVEKTEQNDFIQVLQTLTIEPNLTKAFIRAKNAITDNQINDTIVQARLWELLAWCQMQNAVFRPFTPFHLVRQIRKIIASDTTKTWTPAMIAKQLNMGESTLQRHLAQQNTTLRTLIIHVKMMRALTLLQVTRQPISQIAFAVGYDNHSRFGARFKQTFGCTPSAVRQSTTWDNQTLNANDKQMTVINVGH